MDTLNQEVDCLPDQITVLIQVKGQVSSRDAHIDGETLFVAPLKVDIKPQEFDVVILGLVIVINVEDGVRAFQRYCQMLWMKVVRPLGVMGPWKRAYPGDPWV